MKHEHLPALNKYTSANQYTALQEIDKTGSITSLITQGRMGTTIGALLRSAWMDSEVLTDTQGVTSERWFVTDAGKHAMKLYEIKAEQERQKAEQRAETQRILQEARDHKKRLEKEAFDKMVEYYATKKKLQEDLSLIWDEVSKAVGQAMIRKDEFPYMQRAAKVKAGVEQSTRDAF
jgi:hypothetical protein